MNEIIKQKIIEYARNFVKNLKYVTNAFMPEEYSHRNCAKNSNSFSMKGNLYFFKTQPSSLR